MSGGGNPSGCIFCSAAATVDEPLVLYRGRLAFVAEVRSQAHVLGQTVGRTFQARVPDVGLVGPHRELDRDDPVATREAQFDQGLEGLEARERMATGLPTLFAKLAARGAAWREAA